MGELKSSAVAFLDCLSREMEQAISATRLGKAQVIWRDSDDGEFPEDLLWWSGTCEGQPEASFRIGASPEAWQQLAKADEESEQQEDGYFGLLHRCAAAALDQQLRPGALSPGSGKSETPPAEWARL